MIEKIYNTRCGNIHYWISEKINKDLPFLVFLPGLTADHRLFDKQIDYFKSKANILVWDAPGHFMSNPFELDFNLKDKAIWLNEILNIERFEKPIIVGQSMGGYVGQMYIELFKGTLKGFVSIDSAPLQRKYMTAFEIYLLKHTEGMYRAYPWKLLVDQGAKGCAETEYGIKLMRTMMESYNPKDYVKLVSHGYKILAHAIEENLPYIIDCPTVLICGENDKAGSSKSYNKRWHKIEGYSLYLIKGAGHNSNTDKPDEINNIIDDFVKSL